MGSNIRDIKDIELLRYYHLDKLRPDAWVDEEDLPSWVHDDDLSTDDHGGRSTPRERRNNSASQSNADDDMFIMSEQTDMLGLVNGNILKGKNVRGDAHLISSTQKSFNPQRYLYAVHADTSYDELIVGVDRLKASMDQRSSALKVLVQNNFDRFVSAKNVIDSVYDDMKEKTLNEAQDFGTHRLNTILRESYGKAHEVINPVLERREKIEKLRSTVGLLEPYRLFFNLPNTLQESIKQGKYQQAARDYNKGKVLLAQAFPARSSTASGSTGDNASTHSQSTLLETKRKVFDRVWSEVERIVAKLRADLESQLEEPWRGMEEHERNIKLLFELDTASDPVWHCLSSQYRWIKKIMTESYDEQVILVEELRKSDDVVQSQNMTATGRTVLFRQILAAIKSSEFETTFSKEPEVRVWMAILSGVKTLSELLLRLLPDFWKLATAFMEGKIQKVQKRRTGAQVDPQRASQCNDMVKDIVQLYASQMKYILIKTLIAPGQNVQEDQDSEAAQETGHPRTENAVVSGFFLGRIITEVSNCVNDVSGLSLRGGAFMILVDMMQQIRWKFVETICESWGEDAKVFYRHEDWTLQTENSQITLFVGLFYQFHEHCLRSAYKYASIWTATAEDSVPSDEASAVVPGEYTEKIRKTFLDALYSFLDGLVHLAFADAERANQDADQHLRAGAGSLESLHGGKKSKVIDITELDSRILITISNLSELRSVTIPKLLGDMEKTCGISMADDGKTLVEVVDQLDNILFEDYIKRKTVVANRVITDGILYGGIDWYSIAKPTGVHSFMYEALLSLVVVHAQISEIAPPLVFRALSALLINMAQDCLRCFQQVERFGMGGMLQATLEMEFMNHTLSQYKSPSSDEILQMIYAAVDRAYQPEGGENLQNEMAGLKKLLMDARHATQVQFLCFKKPK
ncbi:exocyst complex component 2 [Entomortierella parvispora]|uniref:Exocyst complex component SEC5 n=1 Tax=Entomortierella parvispora TaxID=205924 RepID=A0A9P3HEC2_9FUNG|nr:exocyst complex component 2 [Entomortierella parvispora]